MTYARFIRGLGWVLLAVSVLVLISGVVVAFSLAGEYGRGGVGEILSGATAVLVVAAVPGVAGWLGLRIGREAG